MLKGKQPDFTRTGAGKQLKAETSVWKQNEGKIAVNFHSQGSSHMHNAVYESFMLPCLSHRLLTLG